MGLIMLDTMLDKIKNDLIEVVNLFENANEFNIKHIFSESSLNNGKHKFVNTFVVNGKAYAYGNLVNFSNDIEYKRLLKRYAKLSLYKSLVAFSGISQPWGALTGIRPTKLAYSQLSNSEDFEDFFVNTMKVSKDKTDLTKRIIESQKGIYFDNNISSENLADLFVFIPFCPTRCSYCSFITSDIRFSQKFTDEYTNKLVKEIENCKNIDRNIRSIYVGGGTPISLSNENLIKILSAISKFNNNVEFTVEAGRPDVITSDKLQILKDFGVTRICINPQTFNDKTLKLIGRNHSAQDVIDKYNLAKGKFLINMDLIAGLENESFEDFAYSLNKTLELSPDNITVHTLCIKKGSTISQNVNRVENCNVSEMVNYSIEKLTEYGYNPYYLYRQKYMAGNLENVGWSKKGNECIYNVDTMEDCMSIIACGANAISKRIFDKGERIERLASPKDIKTYLDKFDKILTDKMKFFS